MHLDGREEGEDWEPGGKKEERGAGRGEQGGGCSSARPVLASKCSWLSAPCSHPHLCCNKPSPRSTVGGCSGPSCFSQLGPAEESQEEQIFFPATPRFSTTLAASKVMSRSQNLLKELMVWQAKLKLSTKNDCSWSSGEKSNAAPRLGFPLPFLNLQGAYPTLPPCPAGAGILTLFAPLHPPDHRTCCFPSGTFPRVSIILSRITSKKRWC